MPARTNAFLIIALFFLFTLPGHCQNHLVAIGDLNGDGQPDIVVANPSLNNIGVFLNTGGGTLGPGAFFAVSGTLNSISLADINGDSHLDILVVSSTGVGHLQVMLGDGKGGFSAPAEVATGTTSGPITNPVVADFNGDGHPDIAFGVNAASPQIAILFGDGHGGFSAPHMVPVANDTTFAADLVLLDANKDGKPDLVVNTARVTAGVLHESFLLLNDGAANFSVSHLTDAGFSGDTAGWATAAADFDNDGFVDLLFGLGSSIFIMFGDGHGGALSTIPVSSLLGPPQGFAADVDGNLTIDLVSPTGSYSPGNGHGGFGDPISLAIPSGSSVIAVGDMNGDGKPDFVVQSGTNVSVVLNSLTAPANISATTALQLSTSASTTSVGLPVTLAATVVSNGGIPSGSVTFFDGGQSLGSAAVDPYGIAAITTSFSVAGLHSNLTANFTGALDPATNTLFLNSKLGSPTSISVNASQPTASAPAVTLTAFPNPARVRSAVTLKATLASSSGTPTGLVVFTADGNVLGISPLPPSLTVTFPAVGLHNIVATYGGDATFPQASSTTLVEDIRTSVAADFTIDSSPQTATIKAGQSATFNLTINPVGDLASTVGFSCSGLPAAATCSFSPASLTPGISPVSTTLTLTTTAPSSAVPLSHRQPGPLFWLFAFVSCLCLTHLALLLQKEAFQKEAFAKEARRKTAPRLALAWAAIAVVFLLGSCGGGSGSVTGGTNGTPVGSSSITVTATSATSHTVALNITVTQ
jgi:hypothetical protein